MHQDIANPCSNHRETYLKHVSYTNVVKKGQVLSVIIAKSTSYMVV